MSDGIREVKPRGKGGGHWPMMPQKIWEVINFKLGLGFGQVYSRWKALEEHKVMMPLFKELREVVRRQKNYNPSLKGYVRDRVCDIP
jgi:hypothetical protein